MSRERILAAIAAKSVPEPMSGCWLWTASLLGARLLGLGAPVAMLPPGSLAVLRERAER